MGFYFLVELVQCFYENKEEINFIILLYLNFTMWITILEYIKSFFCKKFYIVKSNFFNWVQLANKGKKKAKKN